MEGKGARWKLVETANADPGRWNIPRKYDGIGFGIWNWLQQDRIHQGENRSGRSNAQGQQQNDGNGEARRSPYLAQREADVGRDRFHGMAFPRLPATLLHQRDVAERAARSLFSFCAGQILRAHKLLSFLFDMLTE